MVEQLKKDLAAQLAALDDPAALQQVAALLARFKSTPSDLSKYTVTLEQDLDLEELRATQPVRPIDQATWRETVDQLKWSEEESLANLLKLLD